MTTGNPTAFPSHPLPADASGDLVSVSRQSAGWDSMSFVVRRLQPGGLLRAGTQGEEAVFLLLGGQCSAEWGEGKQSIGGRRNVFDGFPWTLYLPAGYEVEMTAKTSCEIAECRVPSTARLAPRLVTPRDVRSSLRGGGNASRQIVDVIPAQFPADKIMVIEVYTPGGNWSSYPPHKHDVHNPPAEVDLDEIYYYRMREPRGFALQHLYGSQHGAGETVEVHNGDTVLIGSGYHPVVAGPGYDVYYLNFLAGSARALAVTEDPRHTWIHSAWGASDPRLPMVRAEIGANE